jgi:uncharacterized membrane protein YebE (DUF533 family)
MGFNIGQALTGGALGFLTGGPIGAIAGGVAGGVSGSPSPTSGLTSLTGTIGNAAAGGWQSSILAQQDYQNYQNAEYSLQLNQQASQFNNMMDEKSEMMRESNTLRDVAMQQKKADTEITKKFIESIG